jgi:hypothetical protein
VQMGEESCYRLYSCRGCSVLVSICNACDYGNIYCPGECAVISRRDSNRRAGARYQRTRRGARAHAARQQAWRDRERQKVTQQGCAPTAPVFTMSITADMAAIENDNAPSTPEPLPVGPQKPDHNRHRQVGRCDFCPAILPAFTRLRTRRGWGFD